MKRIIIMFLCSILVNSMNAQIFDKAKELFNDATSSESSMSALAKQRFIERYEMTTEREARLYGINWYRKPSVTISNKGKLTGKRIIELCNKIANDYPHVNLYKIRSYAADHQNANAGTLYYCSGTFTISDKTYKYVKDQAYVLVIPAIKGVLIYEYSNGTYHSSTVCVNGNWQ